MLTQVEITGFKSLHEETIELGVLNVFIGANGSGKSNVLEAIGVLSAAAAGVVDDESLMRRGVRPGLPRLYKSSFKNVNTPPHITLAAKSRNSEYKVSLLNPLKDPKPAWRYKTERLSYYKKTGFGFSKTKTDIVCRKIVDRSNYIAEKGLAALRIIEEKIDNPAVQLIKILEKYAIHAPDTPKLRGVEPDLQTREPVGLAGGRLADAIKSLQKLAANNDFLDEAFEELTSLAGWFKNIETISSAETLLSPAIPRQQSLLRFTDKFMIDGRNTLTGYDASEGALYMLYFAALALSPSAPQCLAIDNFDQALNPRIAKKMSSMFCEWLLRDENQRQILLTTHSPSALDGLKVTDDRVRLFAVERNSDGHTKVKRIIINEELLSFSREKDWPMSRLWINGYLGGVPNV